VLRAQGSTIAPVGSPNNELGLPRTLLSADEQTEYIVLEMGMRGLGHIAYLCDIAAPTIGVITNIGSAHVGELGGIAQVAQAKGELIEGLPVNGTAVLNFDDPLVRSLAQKTRATVLNYGLNANCDVHCLNLVSTNAGGHEFELVTPTGSAQVKLELPGEHNVSNALAAAAVGHCVGMSASEIAAALSTARLQSKWRMEFHHLPNDITLINDAYNANPDSMAAALKTLVTISSDGRKWAVLGAMHELGDLAIEEHDRIGRLAVRLDVDQLVVVGQAAKPLHLGAQTEGSWDQESVWFPDFEQAADYICQKVAPHDVVLFKASRSEGFEQLAQLVETRLRKDECS
jgi:UDP-N-acetylmuramoyl-tripeptide--D-alanyl-D-alanine ligase